MAGAPFEDMAVVGALVVRLGGMVSAGAPEVLWVADGVAIVVPAAVVGDSEDRLTDGVIVPVCFVPEDSDAAWSVVGVSVVRVDAMEDIAVR